MIVAVSAERFRAVCYPLSKRHVRLCFKYKLIVHTFDNMIYPRLTNFNKLILFLYQSPYKYVLVVVVTSVILKLPRFFQFQLITVDGETDYWTTSIMEDPVYIRFSSYWDDLITTGFLPLAILIFFNLRIYLKVFKHLNILT